jgi:hypothetical protein
LNERALNAASAGRISTSDNLTRQMTTMLAGENAFSFYSQYILSPVREKDELRRAYGFSGGALVLPGDWELFAAILIQAHKSHHRYGHDLAEAEVKSAKMPGSFEYQYHLNTGRQKLEGDMHIDHLFISYSADCEDVYVRVLTAEQLRHHFEPWLPRLLENYASRRESKLDGKQRFRRNIPYGVVRNVGRLILSIERGELSFIEDKPLKEIFPNRQVPEKGSGICSSTNDCGDV